MTDHCYADWKGLRIGKRLRDALCPACNGHGTIKPRHEQRRTCTACLGTGGGAGRIYRKKLERWHSPKSVGS